MLTGAILKEERKRNGMSQKALAQKLDVSPAYVNLIENGHRPMTPQMRQAISEILSVDEARLLGEESFHLVDQMASLEYFDDVDRGSLERLAIEMPDILQSISSLHFQLHESRANLKKLADRLAQDERLSTSLHQLLSVATSIRSTSSILNTQGDLPMEQTVRFRDLLHQDARQLSENLRELVDYLDQQPASDSSHVEGEMKLLRYIEDNQYYLEALETGQVTRDNMLDWLGEILGDVTTEAERVWRFFDLTLKDIHALPKDTFLRIADRLEWQVEALSAEFSTSTDRILRRIVQLSRFSDIAIEGYYVQDQTGSFLIESMPISHERSFELDCPYWPIFDASSERGKLIFRRLKLANGTRLGAFASSQFYVAPQLPSGGWDYKTMIVIQDDAPSISSQVSPPCYSVGFNCLECRIGDCMEGRNGAISTATI